MSDPIEVTHREIYDRLVQVENKIDKIEKGTANVVDAFEAAQGAFKVLEVIAKLAKPLLIIGALITAVGVVWQKTKL